jgi:roadblock/LC7 domain-containing protein
VAADLVSQAQRITASANELAEAQGVFDQQELLRRQITPTDPAEGAGGFDIEARFETLKADAAAGVTSPGVLDPDAWAERADETRANVRSLRQATVFMLIAVAAYTVAEMAQRRWTRLAGFAVGGVVYIVTLIAVLPSWG